KRGVDRRDLPIGGDLPHVHRRRGAFRAERVEAPGTLGQRIAAQVGGYPLDREGREPGNIGGESVEGAGRQPAGYSVDAVPLGQTSRDARVRGRKAPCGEGEAQGKGTGGNGTGSVHPAGEVRLYRTVRTDTGNAGSKGTHGKGLYPL